MKSRRTLGILAAILAVAAFYLMVFRSDPLVEVLNQAIQAKGSPELKNYPYPFRVLRMEGTAAVMSTPRSPAMPVYRMIRAIDPALSGKAPDNPDFVAAEKALANPVGSAADRPVPARRDRCEMGARQGLADQPPDRSGLSGYYRAIA